jgi:hypothetical protein
VPVDLAIVDQPTWSKIRPPGVQIARSWPGSELKASAWVRVQRSAYYRENTMNKSSLGRAGLFLTSLLCLLGVMSGSALASGPPTVGYSEYYPVTLNTAETGGWVTPNGSATTAKVEISVAGGSYKIIKEQSLGEGTTGVFVGASLNGTFPGTYYQARITASNAFGSNSAISPQHRERWKVSTGQVFPGASFADSGTLTFTWAPNVGSTAKISCVESGYGTLGHENAAGDSYHAVGTSCAYYYNEVKQCASPNIELNFNAALALESTLHLQFCPKEENEWAWAFPVALNLPNLSKTPVERHLVLSTSTALGKTVKMTLDTNWKLTGAFIGVGFGEASE